MKIVGIIAEYNPFHNGHQYHIDQALQKTGADAAVILMSGDFVQRGAPAIAPKHLRAKAALLGGASLILELPVLFSCGSAELFARGAVSIFNSLGCISCLCFGSECGDIKKLNRLARILSEEPEVYRQLLQEMEKLQVHKRIRQIVTEHACHAGSLEKNDTVDYSLQIGKNGMLRIKMLETVDIGP